MPFEPFRAQNLHPGVRSRWPRNQGHGLVKWQFPETGVPWAWTGIGTITRFGMQWPQPPSLPGFPREFWSAPRHRSFLPTGICTTVLAGMLCHPRCKCHFGQCCGLFCIVCFLQSVFSQRSRNLSLGKHSPNSRIYCSETRKPWLLKHVYSPFFTLGWDKCHQHQRQEHTGPQHEIRTKLCPLRTFWIGNSTILPAFNRLLSFQREVFRCR